MSSNSSQSWFRQYRPQQVADLHLTSVRTELQSWMKRGRIPQVILLAGPKGTGKTSTARILSALVNDPQNLTALTGAGGALHEPNLSDPDVLRAIQGSSLAIHEQDAASNRGIDDVRSLREQTALPPAEGRVSVYILDEVHMFTTEAFNALLKLLEEPPTNVMFILATTEVHKIPATILSRCALLQFSKASSAELVSALKMIAKAEKISVDDKVFGEIAQRADGSFRDAVKWFEQLARGKSELNEAELETLWPRQVASLIAQLISSVIAKNAPEVSSFVAQLRETGADAAVVHQEFFAQLHTSLLQAHGVMSGTPAWPAAVSHFLLKEVVAHELDAPTPITLLPLEVALLDIVFRAQGNKKAPAPSANSNSNQSRPVPEKTQPIVEPPVAAAPTPTPTPKTDTAISVSTWTEQWPALQQAIRAENASLGSLLISAKPKPAEDSFSVEVYYPFHLEQLTHVKHQVLFDRVTTELFGAPVSVPWKLAKPSEETSSADIASALL